MNELPPKMGRPRKNEQVKNVSLQIKITQDMADKLKKCADTLHVTRTEVIEQGIELVLAKLDAK